MKAECEVELFEEVVIFVASEGDVGDDAWARYVEHVSRPETRFNLPVALGQLGITARQRKVMGDVARARGVETAAVTDSRIVRGMITAVSWVGVRIQAFSMDQLDRAVTAACAGDNDKKRRLAERVLSRIEVVQRRAAQASNVVSPL